eukprot:TRINITY_DN223_c0_g1_i1.p1 TRINITY_DN223_c0_g1~~TRINITY_DN223_c0_g1_i1.p1  ORF type:complete len:204 (-),score=76.84 TRINITY_DN223_c0_g1_i1:70-681(-)
MTILYALISEGTEVVVENPDSEKKLGETARVIIAKVPKQNHKRTYTHEKYNFHYKYSGTRIYLCVADPQFPMRVCYAFLDDVEQKYGANPRGFKSTLRERMDFYNNPSNDKVMKVQEQINEVKGVMMENIDRVLERGEKLSTLVDKTDNLKQSAQVFQKKSTQLKRAMWWKNIKLMGALAAIVLIVILIICLIACGPTFAKCK